MKLRRLTFVCAIAIALTACAKEEKKAVAPSDGRVEGTLAIDGKTYPLKYVYAGRKKASESGQSAGLDVVVTNEPLSYELLSGIFRDLEGDVLDRKDHQVLKGGRVVALYFEIPAYQLENPDHSTVNFDGMLMTPDAFFDYSNLTDVKHEFSEFSLKDGTIAARAESKWVQNKSGGMVVAPSDIKIEVGYSVRFDAKVSEQPLLSRGLSGEKKSKQ